MVDTQIHVVIDNGTGYMKGGFSGENAPRAVFPTLIGTPKENKLLLRNAGESEKYICFVSLVVKIVKSPAFAGPFLRKKRFRRGFYP